MLHEERININPSVLGTKSVGKVKDRLLGLAALDLLDEDVDDVVSRVLNYVELVVWELRKNHIS